MKVYKTKEKNSSWFESYLIGKKHRLASKSMTIIEKQNC